jgi:hypothetical protein
MAKTVKLPDPVFERVSEEASKKDIQKGAVVYQWMKQADENDSILFANSVIDPDMDDLEELIDDLHNQASYALADDRIPDKYAEMQEQLAHQLQRLDRNEQNRKD